MKLDLIHFLYKNFFKPAAFLIDPEIIHDIMTFTGETLENHERLVSSLFSYKNKSLHKKLLGINFDNPVGLSAGFDYDGHLAKVCKSVGFGFNTVGTVTALSYEGNPKPRLVRLPHSKSILVNKGFKSEGAVAVAVRLDKKNLKNHTIGISIGSSNIPEVNTIKKAIEDYLFTFNIFKNKNYVKYFELNISCPNAAMSESFTNEENFKKLTTAISKLKIKQPIFVKMPNEIDFKKSDKLIEIALKKNIKGFIFSNLVKNRKNKFLNKSEIRKISKLKGNFSGRPTYENSNKLIAHTRKKFGDKVVIIGTGGIFTPEDAIAKLDAGADLVQLITGMIYEGPQLIGQINKAIS